MGDGQRIDLAALVLAFHAAAIGIAPMEKAAAQQPGVTAPAACIGDCDASGTVRVNELVTAVTIASGAAELDACGAADPNGDSRVTIDEVVGAVGQALNGCPPDATATVLPTVTATPPVVTTEAPTSPAMPTTSASPALTSTPAPTLPATATASPAPPSTTTPTIPLGPTATVSGTVNAPPTNAASATPTMTVTPGAPTATPNGPRITHLGVIRADNEPLDPDGTDPAGRPVYTRLRGQGMALVVEARPGGNNRAVGVSAFSESGLPDLQMLVSRALGDGRPQVCDVDVNVPEEIGGVPGTPSLSFASQPAIDAVNDLGCRVDDGLGEPHARGTARDACTRSDSGAGFGYGFVIEDSTAQFCLPIADKWAFPPGDTIVAARVRDVSGAVGATKEIVVRVTAGP